MYCNQCFDFRKLMKMNYIECSNLVLSAKMDFNLGGLVVVTSTLSAVLGTQSMYAEFPSWSQRFRNLKNFLGNFLLFTRNLRRTSTTIFSLANPIEACYCGTQRPSYDRKKV